MSIRIGLFAGLLVTGVAGLLPLTGSAAEAQTPGNVNYGRPFEPKVRPALLALPPGAVAPQGWLSDWCLAARNGFTGHMSEYHEAFKQAWATDYTMRGEELRWPKGGWPYEGGGYWFDGLARLGYVLHDSFLIQQTQTRLTAFSSRMDGNGVLFLWWLNKNNAEDRKGAQEDNGWPLWASGLFGRALSGYYAASQDPDALHTLETAYGGDGDWMRMSWAMSNPWPAYDTYTWTGNKAIAAKLDALFAPEGGGIAPGGDSWNRYRQPPSPKPGAEDNDHVVHFLESTTPWALGYLWTGKREFLDSALAWHAFFERIAMQPTGVPVADEWYGPTGAFRGTETCDVAAYLWSKATLFAVTGDGAMGDRMERAFFNAAPATVSRDFKTHVYFQSPNRMVCDSPVFDHGPRQAGGYYRPIHSPLCCTAALNRIVPWYVTHMWMATYDNGLAATCYGPSRVNALVAERVPVEITCQTAYPFSEALEFTVKPSKKTTFPLSFRIPGWCSAPELKVNGKAIPAARDSRGFVRVSRKWKPGDTVSLRFPMVPVVETGIDQAKGTAATPAHHALKVMLPEVNPVSGRPYATVSCGPLLFALAIPDTRDANTPDPAARWKFALPLKDTDLTVERKAMPTQWDWPLDAPLTLSARAVAIDWDPAPQDPRLPEAAVPGQSPAERIKLIPYGCTKFRISMFPVAADRP
ncbi:MAG TPA: glycoside hydrolase family 127 protein [Kiritimatiellia bacterium]|nr:glycoside hydrolase family 127 protein [Kiritimatiellia bacterium]HPS06645.1 glycoside hydrolase family 127 protein [Kiritimatiellia bacterium]